MVPYLASTRAECLCCVTNSYVNPTAPVLLQILSGAMDATSLLPAGSVYVLPPNKVIEVSIPGLAIGGPVRLSSQLSTSGY